MYMTYPAMERIFMTSKDDSLHDKHTLLCYVNAMLCLLIDRHLTHVLKAALAGRAVGVSAVASVGLAALVASVACILARKGTDVGESAAALASGVADSRA